MKNKRVILSLIFLLLIASCRKDITIVSGSNLADWTSLSHEKLDNPNYDMVFNKPKLTALILY